MTSTFTADNAVQLADLIRQQVCPPFRVENGVATLLEDEGSVIGGGSSHIHDNQTVADKLPSGWSHIRYLFSEQSHPRVAHASSEHAAREALASDGIYAIETFLDGDEYAVLTTHLIRSEGVIHCA